MRTRGAPAQRGRSPATTPPAFLVWLRARWGAVQALLPEIAGSPRLRREILGVVMVLIAALTAVVLGRGGDDGQLIAWWGDALRDSFGRAAPLIALLIGLIAVRALGAQAGPVLESRHYLGGFLFAVAVVGLLQLGAGLLELAAGGYLGVAVATLTVRVLGQLGAGLALFCAGVFAVFLLAGSDLQTFWNDLKALFILIWRGCSRVMRAVRTVFLKLPRPNHASAPRTGSISSRPSREAAATDATIRLNLPAVRSAPPRGEATRAVDLTAPLIAVSAPRAAPVLEPEPASTDDLDLDLDLTPVVAAPVVPEAATSRPVHPRPATRSVRRGGGANAAAALEPIAEAPPPVLKIMTNDPLPAPLRLPVLATGLPKPDISRLSYYDSVEPDADDLHRKARLIEETLTSFRVEARVREINPGPAVTQFALEPGTGIKVRRITELQNDLALALAAPSIRIEAPIPGMARVGLEIPNAQIATVGLRETLESAAFTRSKAKLPVPLGRDVNGQYVVGDLTKMPHLLIAGATGAGKSVCLNCIISTFLLHLSPEDLKLVMIDPKMVELTVYNGVPHLQCPVVTEMDKVVGVLRLTLREMERRYTLFATLGVRNLQGYREKIADEPNAERLPYLVVIIDELADLMMTAPDDVETLLVRLAQMARATGIHLILATQRPSVNVVTGLIKTNVPSRIAFAVSSQVDSRVVLDVPGAERLLGKGDMLYSPVDASKPTRVQGAFIDDRDSQYIVEHWHSVAPVPQFAQEWLDLPGDVTRVDGGGEEEDDDPLFAQALSIVKQQGTASASMLQRRLRVGYNRAARLIERMEDDGLIGPADGVRGRQVLQQLNDE